MFVTENGNFVLQTNVFLLIIKIKHCYRFEVRKGIYFKIKPYIPLNVLYANYDCDTPLHPQRGGSIFSDKIIIISVAFKTSRAVVLL